MMTYVKEKDIVSWHFLSIFSCLSTKVQVLVT